MPILRSGLVLFFLEVLKFSIFKTSKKNKTKPLPKTPIAPHLSKHKSNQAQ
jgi:hypothetical protein